MKLSSSKDSEYLKIDHVIARKDCHTVLTAQTLSNYICFTIWVPEAVTTAIVLVIFLFTYVRTSWWNFFGPVGWGHEALTSGITTGVRVNGYGVILIWDVHLSKFPTTITRHH